MCSTPAPACTAVVAASIWSGTGEVNTSPGQAASSIPAPTNPACSGSWPVPPPETRPTLPATGASARRTIRASTSTASSGWAVARPRRASGTTLSGVLISFFTSGVLPCLGGAPSHPPATLAGDPAQRNDPRRGPRPTRRPYWGHAPGNGRQGDSGGTYAVDDGTLIQGRYLLRGLLGRG